MFGAIGMCVCQIIVASVDTALNNNDGNQTSNKILIAFVCLYIFFFGSSWGPVVWVVTGEIFPLKARAKCFSMTTATNWLMNWAIAYATPYLVNDGPGNANLGAKVFYIWGGVCLVCMVLVYFAVYETQGFSLEQIDELYGKIDKAWKSRSFVPTISFAEVDLDQDVKGTTLTDLEAGVERKRADVHVDDTEMLAKI
jgi:SP family sugar:H+ symporter-like MFS transporter